MAAEYKSEDKNQPKPGSKKDESATSGGKPEVSSKVQRELEAGKKALNRRKEEISKTEEAKK